MLRQSTAIHLHPPSSAAMVRSCSPALRHRTPSTNVVSRTLLGMATSPWQSAENMDRSHLVKRGASSLNITLQLVPLETIRVAISTDLASNPTARSAPIRDVYEADLSTSKR